MCVIASAASSGMEDSAAERQEATLQLQLGTWLSHSGAD
jgi:hypothetical protein